MPPPSKGPQRHRGQWRWSYYTEDGTRHWVIAPTAGECRRTVEDAKSAGRRRRKGLEPDPASLPPVPRLVEEYVTERSRFRTPRYVSDLRCQLSAMLEGIVALTQVTPAFLARRRDRMMDAPTRKSPPGKRKSNRTGNCYVKAVLTWLRWCETTGRIPRAPLIRMEMLPQAGEHVCRPPRVISPEQLSVLSRDPRIGDLATLIAATGLRLRVALGLRWRDVVDGTVVVRPDVQGNRKTRRERRVPMPPWLAGRLSAIRRQQGTRLGRLPGDDDRVILSPRGLPLDVPGGAERCYRWLRKALDRSGIPHRTREGVAHWHALRHTYATWLGQHGATAPQIAAALGHSGLSEVSRYAHADRISAADVVSRMPAIGSDGDLMETRSAT